MVINQKVLPAITDLKSLKRFIKSDLTYCVLMNIHISHLKDFCSLIQSNNKKCIVHIDLIKGLNNDEYGTEYLCQVIKVDGIISTKPNVINTAKKNNILSIQRIFLIDSQSLERSFELIKRCEPDFIEVLPAIAYSITNRIKKETNIPIIGGGLISDENDIRHCLESGMISVTTSNILLWDGGVIYE